MERKYLDGTKIYIKKLEDTVYKKHSPLTVFKWDWSCKIKSWIVDARLYA